MEWVLIILNMATAQAATIPHETKELCEENILYLTYKEHLAFNWTRRGEFGDNVALTCMKVKGHEVPITAAQHALRALKRKETERKNAEFKKKWPDVSRCVKEKPRSKFCQGVIYRWEKDRRARGKL